MTPVTDRSGLDLSVALAANERWLIVAQPEAVIHAALIKAGEHGEDFRDVRDGIHDTQRTQGSYVSAST